MGTLESHPVPSERSAAHEQVGKGEEREEIHGTGLREYFEGVADAVACFLSSSFLVVALVALVVAAIPSHYCKHISEGYSALLGFKFFGSPAELFYERPTCFRLS